MLRRRHEHDLESPRSGLADGTDIDVTPRPIGVGA